MASGRPDARTLADQMIVTMADRLRDGEAVATGLNSHIPILAVAVAKIVHGKKLRLLTVAEAHDPELESVRLTYSTGDPSWAELGSVLPMIETFDLVQQGKLDVMFLGPLQIDAETNFNLSVIGPYERPKVRLTGGAASAFIAPLVKRLFYGRPSTPRGTWSRGWTSSRPRPGTPRTRSTSSRTFASSGSTGLRGRGPSRHSIPGPTWRR
jgi:glutaconate CoA-transferase subunit B